MVTLDDAWKLIQQRGPSEVLVDRAGTTVLPAIAKRQNVGRIGYGDDAENVSFDWDVLFIRNDGYSLACDFYLQAYAERLYRADWIGVVLRGRKDKNGRLTPRPVHYTLDSVQRIGV